MQGRTMLDLGQRNELIVLDAVRSAPEGTSQSEVVTTSGLSRQAVSLITRRLRERGLIETDGTLAGSRGKPRTVLRIVPTAQVAAGVHLDPSQIALVVVDLLGRPVLHRSLPAPTDSPTDDIARIAGALRGMQEALEAEGWRTPGGATAREAMLGIGVASPGGIDVRRGLVVNPPWLPGWRGVPLVEELGAATGLPVVLDKDTNAALTAENWSAGQRPEERVQEETVLYVLAGAGIGSAVSVGGRVHHGAAALAGEIGHLPTGLDGEMCGCGRRACLSRFTDVSVLLDAMAEAGLPDPERSGDGCPDSLAPLSRAAQDGEPVAAALLEGYGAALGEALRSLVGIHDPHRVVLGGPHWDVLAPHVLGAIEERVRRDAPPEQVVIESSRLGDGVGALGAAALFLQRELSPAVR
ncbi:ROK family transcriptional regulator [Brachybacterium conglomeratum]|uniref:ROK family transcriptional regulator n=1 Tax=Brachybacterium conglomeratum TaxID=47846 RepID=UPI003DA038A4